MSALDPFIYHGVIFTEIPKTGSGQAKGECPFCGKDDHFYVDIVTSQWDCKRCLKSGNNITFMEQYHEKHLESTTKSDYKLIKKYRGSIVSATAYKNAEFAFRGDSVIFPVRSMTGRVQDLRVAQLDRQNNKFQKIRGTKGCKIGIWNIEELVDPDKHHWDVWVCEGEWDGIALRYITRKLGLQVIIIATPGTSLKKEYVPIFNNRKVTLLFDCDKAGDIGMATIGLGEPEKGKSGVLSSNTKSIKYIRWPLTIDDSRKYDISELIKEFKDPKDIVNRIKHLIADKPRSYPLNNIKKEKLSSGKKTRNKKKKGKKREDNNDDDSITIKPVSYNGVVKSFSNNLKMSPDRMAALRVIVATILTTEISGDPLWVYIVAPPGSGKTALLNPLRDCEEKCIFRSSVGPKELVSGFQAAQDPSLLPKCNGKTLVLKDLTELIRAPGPIQEEVFGTLTGAYDGHVERSYGNNVHRSYDTHFSMLAGVTKAIYGNSKASLGIRTLKLQLIKMDKDGEDELLSSAMNSVGLEGEMNDEMGDSIRRFLLTVEQRSAKELHSEIPQSYKERIKSLSQIIARLRTTVDRDFKDDKVLYRPDPEVATRLAKQLIKLSMGLTYSLPEKGEFSEEEFGIVEDVAFHTSTGWNLDLVESFARVDSKRVTRKDLVDISNLPASNISRSIEDMKLLRLIIEHRDKDAALMQNRVYYELDPELIDLWKKAKITKNHLKVSKMIRSGQIVNSSRMRRKKKK